MCSQQPYFFLPSPIKRGSVPRVQNEQSKKVTIPVETTFYLFVLIVSSVSWFQHLREAITPDKIMSSAKPIAQRIKAEQKKGIDYTYGRLYDEQRFYLNKSGTKTLSIGVKPGIHVFKCEIRLQSAGLKPYMLVLDQKQLLLLFNLIKETPGIIHTQFTYPADLDEDEDMQNGSLLQTSRIDKNIMKIILPDDQYMFLGMISLQKLLDFEPLITQAYEALNADYLKETYDTFVDLCLDANYPLHKFEAASGITYYKKQ